MYCICIYICVYIYIVILYRCVLERETLKDAWEKDKDRESHCWFEGPSKIHIVQVDSILWGNTRSGPLVQR